MILIYWLSATGGNVLSGILQPNVVTVGADAIVFGLLAITSVELIQNWPVRPFATSLSRLSFSFCRTIISSDNSLSYRSVYGVDRLASWSRALICACWCCAAIAAGQSSQGVAGAWQDGFCDSGVAHGWHTALHRQLGAHRRIPLWYVPFVSPLRS